MVLRGIFLLTQAELRWFYQDGCSWIYPEAFAEFQRLIPPAERGDMIAAYHRRLTSSDLSQRLAAARAWSIWEGTTLSLIPELTAWRASVPIPTRWPSRGSRATISSTPVSSTADGELLIEAGRLKDIPGVIVHGRYDVCDARQKRGGSQ